MSSAFARRSPEIINEAEQLVLFGDEAIFDLETVVAEKGDARVLRPLRDSPVPLNARTVAEILHSRDKGVCGICLTPVDFGFRNPHPASAQADHIIPQSMPDTTHTWDNLRLTHRQCNIERGNESKGMLTPARAYALLLRQTHEWENPLAYLPPRIAFHLDTVTKIGEYREKLKVQLTAAQSTRPGKPKTLQLAQSLEQIELQLSEATKLLGRLEARLQKHVTIAPIEPNAAPPAEAVHLGGRGLAPFVMNVKDYHHMVLDDLNLPIPKDTEYVIEILHIRDHGICGICHTSVDFDLQHPHPARPHTAQKRSDRITAFAAISTKPEWDSLRLTHYLCDNLDEDDQSASITPEHAQVLLQEAIQRWNNPQLHLPNQIEQERYRLVQLRTESDRLRQAFFSVTQRKLPKATFEEKKAARQEEKSAFGVYNLARLAMEDQEVLIEALETALEGLGTLGAQPASD